MSDKKDETLTEEELEAAAAEGLPDREVMSTVAPLGDDVGAFGDPFQPGVRPEGDTGSDPGPEPVEKPGPQPA